MATSLLLSQLNGTSSMLYNGVRVEIPVEIIIRESVKKLNKPKSSAKQTAE